MYGSIVPISQSNSPYTAFHTKGLQPSATSFQLWRMRMGMGKGKNRNAGAGIGGNCKIDEDASPYMLEGERPDKRLASPPGSGSIESFLNLCTGCQICTAACKSQILKPSLTEWGLSGFMQPFMDFSQGFCLHTCHACTKACPTGAIKL